MSQLGCLYCTQTDGESTSVAHVFPEAVYPGGPALPTGTMCDGCNHYFGANLEPMLLRHPFVGFPLQLLGLLGKDRKPREQLGVFSRLEDAAVSLPIGFSGYTQDQDGSRGASVVLYPGLDPHFDLWLFRRALHLIAFNHFAWYRGPESARDGKYQSVREYVRRGQRRERWAFIQDGIPPDPIEPKVGARHMTFEGTTIVGIRLFNTDYYVDLENRGALSRFTTDWRGTGGHLVPSKLKRYPVPPGLVAGKYRLDVE